MTTSSERKKVDHTALYKIVERRICSAIANGELRPGERLAPPENLAKAWGLSVGTLRQALQILAARGVVIRKPKMGTCVNPDFDFSRGLDNPLLTSTPKAAAIEASNCIAMVVPDVINADYATVMRGAESAAEAAHFNVIVGNSEDDPTRLNQVIRQQVKQRVSGLIILTGKQTTLDFAAIKEIQESRIPVVACYRPIGLVEWPVVRTDGLYNTALITRHLCSLGRKNIALYDFASDSEIELHFKTDGQMGFISALNEAGIIYDKNLHLEYPLGAMPHGRAYYVITDQEVESAKRWLKDRPQVDAVLCVLPRLAAIMVRALEQLDRDIPGDVAVAAMGEDGHLFGLGVDWLTTQTDKWSDIGKRACDLVLSLQRGEVIPPNTTITLKGTLSIGGSTVGKASRT
jgi:DNA-binding LacI/PurR family transcriptional regulator